MNTGVVESTVEDAALTWFQELGYAIVHGPEIAPGELFAERQTHGDIILVKHLREALARINPHIPQDAIEEAIRRVLHPETASLTKNNRRFHQMLVEGVTVSYQRDDEPAHDQVKLIDFDEPANNDWAAINQFTIIESRNNRRPDILIFINGLPLGVIELKNIADENATIKGAFNQLQTYKKDISSLFPYNEVMVVSDGIHAKAGTLTSDWERFAPWRTVDGKEIAPKNALELPTLIKGMFEKERFLDLIRNFIVFEDDGGQFYKKMAGYHQFHAVNKAVESTVKASAIRGDRRAGVIWHTQGSGKSLSMVFYAGKLIQHPKMENPTLVVLTDRIDLDGQLFGTFSRCEHVLRQTPEQADDREDLETLLRRSSGGVIFTTIQKFFPESKGQKYPILSDRRNIVVIADEAHRSQYDFIDGFARHMRDALPNASFIGFTGTPIETDDRSTPAVFGDYIDVYDIQRAVEDEVTVRIYYEGRLAKLELKEAERPRIDSDFEEVTEGEEVDKKEKLKTRWARLEAMVGADKRIALVAQDLVDHVEKRFDAMQGKAMVVAMSRRICAELYEQIVKLRPGWHHDDDDKGVIKIVTTGSAADDAKLQPHIRNKKRREELAKRFKNENDSLKLVIVRDMWLTGFDVPCLHTMYVDKPMQGHGLMQAIARVNRVFKDKEGGLIVDYLGLADQLKKAMANYTQAGGKGQPTLDQEAAVRKMQEHFDVARSMLHGFDYSKHLTAKPAQRLQIVYDAADFIITQENGKQRYLSSVAALSRAFALSVPHEKAMAVRDEIGFFQTVRGTLIKSTVSEDERSPEMLDSAIRQIVSRAVASDEVIDIFSAAGLGRPDISILSDEFLEEVRRLPQKNLAIEALRKLLNDQIKVQSKKNLVQSRLFSEMLQKSIQKYQNRSLDTAEIIAELVNMARDLRESQSRGEKLKLSEEELAFYDALEVNDSAVKVLGDETLKQIALELVDSVRKNATIDWTMKESVRARMRTMVKRILRKYGYPPDKQEKATFTVLEQAELIAKDWVA
ncbi:MAG TPA: type I restriction endonuclease subunit R [Candidatus Angelobacter sp.]|nr:type I restriction endonuclease subunit R [Candidatus Angelobacter sp.]